jgi:hypothetical protein
MELIPRLFCILLQLSHNNLCFRVEALDRIANAVRAGEAVFGRSPASTARADQNKAPNNLLANEPSLSTQAAMLLPRDAES